MPQRQFANQKALVAYAERNGLAYLWEGTPSFAKRQRLLSPEQGTGGGPAPAPRRSRLRTDPCVLPTPKEHELSSAR